MLRLHTDFAAAREMNDHPTIITWPAPEWLSSASTHTLPPNDREKLTLFARDR